MFGAEYFSESVASQTQAQRWLRCGFGSSAIRKTGKRNIGLFNVGYIKDSVLFVVPFSALLSAGCFCLTEYCIHWELLSYFDE